MDFLWFSHVLLAKHQVSRHIRSFVVSCHFLADAEDTCLQYILARSRTLAIEPTNLTVPWSMTFFSVLSAVLATFATVEALNLRASLENNLSGFAEDNHSVFAPRPHAKNYQFMATTTRYGTNPHTACGLDSAALVHGTKYLAVASAQAMQNGCCRCNRNGGGGQTAGMGCGSCGKGRFVRQLPRGFKIWTPAQDQIFHKEYKFVVVDICPHSSNDMWCPAEPGQANRFGVHNHFDFATVPHHFDNYYFEFTPEPCDHEMQSRLAQMSKCHLRWRKQVWAKSWSFEKPHLNGEMLGLIVMRMLKESISPVSLYHCDRKNILYTDTLL